jgi:hypothetical protein
MAVAGTVLGLVAQSAGSGISASDVLGQAVAGIPAVWALVAVALAAVGANPRIRLVGWLAPVATFALTIFGPLFRLWNFFLGISPFWHVPNITASGLILDGQGSGYGGSVDIEPTNPWNILGRHGCTGGAGTSAHVVPATRSVVFLLAQVGDTGPHRPAWQLDFWRHASRAFRVAGWLDHAPGHRATWDVVTDV